MDTRRVHTWVLLRWEYLRVHTRRFARLKSARLVQRLSCRVLAQSSSLARVRLGFQEASSLDWSGLWIQGTFIFIFWIKYKQEKYYLVVDWIKLTGEAAVEAKNVCLPIVDTQQTMKTHGIVQLFTVPHPSKLVDRSYHNEKAPWIRNKFRNRSDVSRKKYTWISKSY